MLGHRLSYFRKLLRDLNHHLGHHTSCHSVTLWQSVLAYSDRKSTRLNSSHLVISYAVFCLKKKKDAVSNAQLVNPKRVRHAWYGQYGDPLLTAEYFVFFFFLIKRRPPEFSPLPFPELFRI